MKYAHGFLIAAALLTGACDGESGSRHVVGELASDRVELVAEAAETLVAIHVEEGSAVSAGDVLAELDARRAEARLREAEAGVLEAEARRDELLRGPRSERIAAARANLDGARQDVTFQRSEYERAESIFERKLSAPESLDRARAALDAAEANLRLRSAQLEELLAGTTVEELAQAEQALARASAVRDRASIDLEQHRLTAPADGVLDSRLFEVGERPSLGQPVFVLLTGTQPYARAFVPEEMRVHVTPGTGADVYVDGLDRMIEGRVRWIASEAAFTPYYALTEHDRGRLTYLAKIDLEMDGERLPDGVPLRVELHTDVSP